jgi:hypothetical protein
LSKNQPPAPVAYTSASALKYWVITGLVIIDVCYLDQPPFLWNNSTVGKNHMKNPKKTRFPVSVFLIGTVFFLLAASVWSQTNPDAVPVFDKKPSTVLDLWKDGNKGKYRDYVKLTNATLHQNISFNIYGYEQKSDKWVQIGSAQFKESLRY